MSVRPDAVTAAAAESFNYASPAGKAQRIKKSYTAENVRRVRSPFSKGSPRIAFQKERNLTKKSAEGAVSVPVGRLPCGEPSHAMHNFLYRCTNRFFGRPRFPFRGSFFHPLNMLPHFRAKSFFSSNTAALQAHIRGKKRGGKIQRKKRKISFLFCISKNTDKSAFYTKKSLPKNVFSYIIIEYILWFYARFCLGGNAVQNMASKGEQACSFAK